MTTDNSSVGITWYAIPDMRSCTSQTVTWLYQESALIPLDAAVQFAISVTNLNVMQKAPVAASARDVPTAPTRNAGNRRQASEYNGYNGAWLPYISQNLANDLNPASVDGSWTWPVVNLTQGWYTLVADVASVRETSSEFFVANGTTSYPCLADAHAAPHRTSSASAFPTSSSSSTSDTTTATGTVVSHMSPGKSHAHIGFIAGGVTGGMFLVVGILVAFFVVYRRRRYRVAFTTSHVRLEGQGDSATDPDPYIATIEQYPIRTRTALLPLPTLPTRRVEKQLRQPIRQNATISNGDNRVTSLSLPLEGSAIQQAQHTGQMEHGTMEMLSMSPGRIHVPFWRFSRVMSNLQRHEGSDDAGSSTAPPPAYEEIARS